jgi:hypothetical protein
MKLFADPQFLYMILVLPSLFGLTLVGDGLYRIAHKEVGGFLNLVFGVLFIGMVVFTFAFFMLYLSRKV